MSSFSSVNEAVSRGAQGYPVNDSATIDRKNPQVSRAFNRETTDYKAQVRVSTGAVGGRDAGEKTIGERRFSPSHSFSAENSQQAEANKILEKPTFTPEQVGKMKTSELLKFKEPIDNLTKARDFSEGVLIKCKNAPRNSRISGKNINQILSIIPNNLRILEVYTNIEECRRNAAGNKGGRR